MIPAHTFKGKEIALFGLGGSGLATAQALVEGGARVLAWDDNPDSVEKAAAAGVPTGNLRSADWSRFASFVLSPGVPLTHPKPHWTVDLARQAGVEVIGDVEIFCRERAASAPDAPFIAITGTNGKSTTTALTAHILKSAGRDTQMGGNIGRAVLTLDPPAANRFFVVECSSYQIDLAPSLDPSAAVLLNLTPDHLDRHGTMEDYAAIKERLVAGAKTAIVGVDDAFCRAIADRLEGGETMRGVVPPLRLASRQATSPPSGGRGRVLGMDALGALPLPPEGGEVAPQSGDGEGEPSRNGHPTVEQSRRVVRISKNEPLYSGCFADGTDLIEAKGGHLERIASLSGIGSLRGAHNAQNALAAVAACRACGLSLDEIQAGLRSFPGLAHRMEQVGRLGDILFVNDSKATNADAAAPALSSFERVFWIAGGLPKEGGIEPLRDLFPRIAKAYLIGEAAPQFAATLGDAVPYEIAGTLVAAVERAARDAAGQHGASEAVVLLSPACASFDQFKNFEKRGEAFRAAVLSLPGIAPIGGLSS